MKAGFAVFSLILFGVLRGMFPDSADAVAVPGGFQGIPFAFTVNQGQWDPDTRFAAGIRGVGVRITSSGPEFYLQPGTTPSMSPETVSAKVPGTLRLGFPGARPAPSITGEDRLSWNTHWITGDSPSRWRTEIPNYSRVRYHDLYEGVDLVCSGGTDGITYDLIIQPGAHPENIFLRYTTAGDTGAPLSIDSSGNLVISTPFGGIIERKPVCYQVREGKRVDVEARFRLSEGISGEFSFVIGAYDPALELIIDPELIFSTFIGGTGTESVNGIARDKQGKVYLAGIATFASFYKSAGVSGNTTLAFVARVSASGDSLEYTTFFGGNEESAATCLTVDDNGNAYVAGYTNSPNFPVKAGSYTTGSTNGMDAFITKFNPYGEMVYSSRIGGSGEDAANAIRLDRFGYACVTGYTASTEFPTTPGAYDTTHNGSQDAFFLQLGLSGSSLVFSTFLGGTLADAGTAFVLDANNDVYIAGTTFSTNFPITTGAYDTRHNGNQDVFVAKLGNSGTVLSISTYIGGTSADAVSAMEIGPDGSLFLAGVTSSSNFPMTAGSFDTSFNGSQDAFALKLNPALSKPVYSTFIGGSSYDYASSVAVNSGGYAYVSGATASSNFPVTSDAYDGVYGGGYDIFLVKLNPFGSGQAYSTFLGASGDEMIGKMCFDGAFSVDLTGNTTSTAFPVTPNPLDGKYDGVVDAFLTRFTFSPDPVSSFMITAVRDIPNDQGRQVRVEWSPHLNDSSASTTNVISSYSIWRKIDRALPSARKLSVIPSGEWDFIREVPAIQATSYAAVVPTLADSTGAGGIYYSEFFISALTDNPKVHYETVAEKGYSVDNISPNAVRKVAAAFRISGNLLTWNASEAPDLSHYEVFQGTASGFAPSPENRIGTSVEPELLDTRKMSGEIFYKVAAFDFAGNTGVSDPCRFVLFLPPEEVTVSDVPGDQGHSLRVAWKAPSEPLGVVHRFRIYRSRSPELTEPLPLTSFSSLESLISAEEHSTVLIDSVRVPETTFTDPFVPCTGKTYYYWVQAVGLAGVSKPAPSGTVVAVNETPRAFRVWPPSPNPFNPSTTLRVDLAEKSPVRITVYTAAGTKVEDICDTVLSPGTHAFTWKPERCAAGLYLYLVRAGNEVRTGKMMLVR